MNLHIFAGVRETYHKPTLNVAAAMYSIDDDYYHAGHAHQTLSVVELLASVVSAITESLLNLDANVIDNTMRVICNTTTGWDYAMFDKLANAANPTKVLDVIQGNKDMPDKEAWVVLAESFIALRDIGIKTTTKYKEIPTTIKEALVCDTACAQAYYHTLVNPDNGLEITSQLKDAKKKKGKALPSIIVDKYMFNWMPTGDIAVCCTCNTELENKKAKSKKSDPLVDRGSVYYGGDNKRLRVAGRTSAEDRYNVIILKEKCAFLEGLFEYQNKVLSTIYSARPAVMYRLDKINGGGIGNRIEDKDFSMIGNDLHGDLFTLSSPREDLSYIFNPPRLAFKIKRIMEQNLARLISVINMESKLPEDLAITDITDYFYGLDDKGKTKLNGTLTTKTKDVRLKDINTPQGIKIKPKALIKYDLPTRNEMNRMAKDNPKVQIVTWQLDEHIVGYSFVFSTDVGWLYYSSEYGSRHLLPSSRKSQRKDK